MLKIFDYILIVLLLLFAFSFNFIVNKLTANSNSDQIVVTINGEYIESHSLEENGEFVVPTYNNNYNKFLISNGTVAMIDANCPDKYCLHSAPIQYNSQTIVCLPNKVVLEIESKDPSKQPEVDAVVQ